MLLHRQDTYKGNPWQPWTQNLYAYVGNNPINYVDPTGHERGAIVSDSVPTLGFGCFLYDDCALVTARDNGFGFKSFLYAVTHLPDFLVEGSVIGFSCALSGGKHNALCKDLDKMGLHADNVTVTIPKGADGTTVNIQTHDGKTVTIHVDADGKTVTVTSPDGKVTPVEQSDQASSASATDLGSGAGGGGGGGPARIQMR